jgi:putative MATE family efflux protein
VAAEKAKAKSYERSEAMGLEPTTKLLFRFSIPAIIAAETSAGYNLFDAIWCGRLSTEALAALTVAAPLMSIYRAIGTGIAVGAASLIGRRLGAGEREEANRAAGCSISFFLILSSLVTVVCLVNLEALLRLFGADDMVLPHAWSYMYIETLSLALDFLLVVLVDLVRVEGRPMLANASMVIASVIDLIWSPILVFGIGPFPALGIAGAALGTTIGRGVGVSVLLAYLGLGKSIYEFKLSHFRPNPRIIAEIYGVGISQTVRASGVSVAQIIASRAASSFGVVPLAVLGVLMKVNMIVFAFCLGVGQGMLPLVAYNFAAQKKERVGELVVKAGLTSATWGAMWWIIATLFSSQVMSLFSPDPDFLAGGPAALRIFALGFFTIGLQHNLSAFFQATGRAIPSLVVASSRQIIFLIPCLLILPNLLGLTGLWIAYPLADALSAALSLAWTVVAFRSMGIPFRLKGS